jgi:signal peptidase I
VGDIVPQPGEAVPGRRPSEEIPLSGPALAELLQAVMKKGIPFTFRVSGTSMFPFIRDGDVVTVSPQEGRAPRFGDVVLRLAADGQQVLVHRVIGTNGGAYLTRGDASSLADGPAALEHVLGRVVALKRRGRVLVSGLGPERYLIAATSRSGILRWALAAGARLIRLVRGSSPP